MFKRLTNLVLTFGLFSTSGVFAADTDSKPYFGTTPSVRTWGEVDGMISENPLHTIQSKDGFIWIGTYEGLMKFDGSHFTIISSDEYPEIKHHAIAEIAESPSGAIWFGGGGAGIYRYKNGNLRTWDETDGFDLEVVVSIAINSNNQVFACSPHKLFRIDADTGEVTH